MAEHKDNLSIEQVDAILTDRTASSPDEVFRRCKTLEQLSACGPSAIDTLPAIIRSLVVGVSVDCVLCLRVAAAEAAWKVGRRRDLALPFLAWALKDEYWGVSRKAAEVLREMGPAAHEAVPDLIRLAERRLECGPFHFETFGDPIKGEPLLAVFASALGSCGPGLRHQDAAARVLTRIVSCGDDVCSRVAQDAIASLKDMIEP